MPEGAKCFANLDVDDWTPLVEIAPEHAHVLTIFIWAWEKGTAELGDEQSKNGMRSKIDKGIQALVSSFIGTDATSLLEFISHLLRTLDEHVGSPYIQRSLLNISNIYSAHSTKSHMAWLGH